MSEAGRGPHAIRGAWRLTGRFAFLAVLLFPSTGEHFTPHAALVLQEGHERPLIAFEVFDPAGAVVARRRLVAAVADGAVRCLPLIVRGAITAASLAFDLLKSIDLSVLPQVPVAILITRSVDPALRKLTLSLSTLSRTPTGGVHPGACSVTVSLDARGGLGAVCSSDGSLSIPVSPFRQLMKGVKVDERMEVDLDEGALVGVASELLVALLDQHPRTS